MADHVNKVIIRIKTRWGQSLASCGKATSFQNPTKLGNKQQELSARFDNYEKQSDVLPVTRMLGAVIITSLYNFGCIYRLDLNMIGIFTSFVG